MRDHSETTKYETPTIRSVKSDEIVSTLGPAFAVYGDLTGGSSGSGGQIGGQIGG